MEGTPSILQMVTTTVAAVVVFTVVFTALLKKFRSKPKPKPKSDLAVDAGIGAEGYEFEVFLSFRGPDTRHGFTDFLYHALVDAGIRVFRDDEELRTGEEIGLNLLQAIEHSKISMPIFSKSYASSKWCLKELTCMLEFKKRGNHMILPVFYDVTPTEVQDQTGDYGRALHEHEKKHDSESVEQWKAALTEIGHLKGMDLVNLANGYQGKLVKLIVSKVLSELKKAHVIVTDYLVGIDDHVEAFQKYLQPGANTVKFVGIWGMGGIGKTTLSKVIYNKVLNDFQCCSFIQDIREASRRNGLEYLQGSLVSDLSRCEPPCFKTVDEGIHMLKERYRGKKVIIVLDDIDDTKHVDTLGIRHDSFGQGSRIIITTRNKEVLDRVEVDCIYEAKAMNQDYALELFCKHAFRRDTPIDDLSSLSRDIVKTTGGLPLALEVIGSLLYGKNQMIWKATLEKLRMVPNEEIQNKLLVSFEALDDEQKQIFLDIACFFIGEDISKIFPMWEDCNFFPVIGIDVLVAKSLIKIGDNKLIWMHDQVRDLGREIVRKENCKDPGSRSRLWNIDDAEKVLTNQMGSSSVEAIRVHGKEHHFTSEQFTNLPNLRFLDLGSALSLAGDFKNLLPSLQWLRWSDCSFGTMNNLCFPNLVCLELPYNDLTDDEWKGCQSVQMMKLKVLNLRGSGHLTRTPDFSAFPNLERLIMSECFQLRVIDPSISKLKKLTYLDISWRFSWGLPFELDSFSAVLPSYFPTRLITLNVSKFPYLSKLSLSNLKLLKTLDARRCSQLQELVGLDQLYALESLHITNCRSIKSLPDLSKLQQLQVLCASKCDELEELVGLNELTSLKILRIRGCKQLKKLPDLSKLKKLESLSAGGCEKLQEVVGFGELNALKVVHMSRCKEIRNLPDLSMLNQLEKLNLFGCEKLQELVGLGELEALESLTIAGCKEIEKLPDLSKLKRLKYLSATCCEKLRGLLGLDKLGKRIELHIDGCKQIENLPQLVELRLLSSLDYINEVMREEMRALEISSDDDEEEKVQEMEEELRTIQAHTLARRRAELQAIRKSA